MKIIASSILILTLFACSKETGRNNNGNLFRAEPCNCEKTIKTDTVIFAADVRLRKETENDILIFHCASVQTGIASVSDVNGNNEHCEAMYDVECTSSNDTHLQLSKDFKYFAGQLLPQQQFFEEVKTNKKDYFELTLGPDRKINSVAKLNIK